MAASDQIWGEHEVDYILFVKTDVDINPNPEEVQNFKYVNQIELKEMIQKSLQKEILLTPWFDLIANSYLWKWWDSIINDDTSIYQDELVHHM